VGENNEELDPDSGRKLLRSGSAVFVDRHDTQLFGQDANRANRPAAAAKPKSTANSKARMERVANGIDPIDLTKGKAPVRLDILKLMNLYKVPGLSVAVIEDYKIAWTKCYGVTEPGGTVPVTPKTLFQAGSISKPVAAAGMLRWFKRANFRWTKT